MELLGIFRALWRRRALAALVVVFSLAVAVFTLYSVSPSSPTLQSRATTWGYARERVLVDTPTSLLADARAKGANAIASEATYLGNLLASDEAQGEIARRLALAGSEIAVVSDADALPQDLTPLAVKAVEVAYPKRPYLVSVDTNPNLPILLIESTAPDRRRAIELAAAATATLRVIAGRDLPPGAAVTIDPLEGATNGVEELAPSKVKAAITALVLLALGCMAIVGADYLLRRRSALQVWREARSA